MNTLREIVVMLSKYKMSKIDIIGNEESESRFTKLYNLIKEGQIKSDEDAAQLMYGTTPADPNYRKLKSEFKERILNVIPFIDVKKSSFSDAQVAYYTCWKEWAAVKVLAGRVALIAALEIAEKFFKDAVRYDITELAMESARFLKGRYAESLGNKKTYDYYKEQFWKYHALYEMEVRSEEAIMELKLPYVKDKSTKKDLYMVASSHYNLLKPYLSACENAFIHRNIRMVELMKYGAINNYTEMLRVCNDAIVFFENKHPSHKYVISIFLHQKAICQMMLLEYEKAEETVIKSEGLIDEGTQNWFINKQLCVELYLHSDQFNKAYQTYLNVIKHKQFDFLTQFIHEEWKIYEAYLLFLVNAKHITLPDANPKVFKISKFLNEVPTFMQDKRGLNVPILVVQILHLMQNKQFDAIGDRLEALLKYSTRYLKEDETFRSNAFIKILQESYKVGFSRRECEEMAKPIIEDIKTVPLNIAEQRHDLELIPYERLWGMMLNLMSNRAWYAA